MAPCDEILNLERSSGIPLGGKNASHQRYKTAGKLLSFLLKEASRPGLTEQSNFNLLPKNCRKEGQILLNSSLNPDFGDCYSRPPPAATPDVKAHPFCQRTEQDHLSLVLNHGLGGWRYKNLRVRDSSDPGVMVPSSREVSSHPATDRTLFKGTFSTSPAGAAPLPTSTRRVTGL